MYVSGADKEASLYYLYMMADGEVSYSEEKLFDSICTDLGLDSHAKEDIITHCKEVARVVSDDFNLGFRKKLYTSEFLSWASDLNKSDLARIMWNFVNLGYADLVYSNEEKEIVNYLVDKWSVSAEMLQEFVDIADTILALSKQKEWTALTFERGSLRDKKEKAIDLQIAEMLKDVKLTIKEIAM